MFLKAAAAVLSVVLTTSHAMENGVDHVSAGLHSASQIKLVHIRQYDDPKPEGKQQNGACEYAIVLACFKKRSSATRWRIKLGPPRPPGKPGLSVESTRSYRELHNDYFCVTEGPYSSQSKALLAVETRRNNSPIFARQCRGAKHRMAQK